MGDSYEVRQCSYCGEDLPRYFEGDMHEVCAESLKEDRRRRAEKLRVAREEVPIIIEKYLSRH